jgi:hypothetical protein
VGNVIPKSASFFSAIPAMMPPVMRRRRQKAVIFIADHAPACKRRGCKQAVARGYAQSYFY